MLSKNQAVFAKNIAKLILKIEEDGNHCTFGEALRTPEQAALYEKEGKGIKNSLHCQRLACDLNLFTPVYEYQVNKSFYEPYGVFWESLHTANKWGGNFVHKDGTAFSDSNHFQMSAVD